MVVSVVTRYVNTFNMAPFQSECVEVLCRLSEIIQTNEDPSSFENSCAGLRTFNRPKNTDQSSLTESKIPAKSDVVESTWSTVEAPQLSEEDLLIASSQG